MYYTYKNTQEWCVLYIQKHPGMVCIIHTKTLRNGVYYTYKNTQEWCVLYMCSTVVPFYRPLSPKATPLIRTDELLNYPPQERLSFLIKAMFPL